MPEDPIQSRPVMPGYGLPDAPADPAKASWARAEQQLESARNYWVATAGPSGRPHAMPVWGLWIDGRLVFGTGRQSRKGRDLASRPQVAVHLESGDDAVIIEGQVEEVRDLATLERYASAFEEKYQFRPDPADPGNAYYAVRSHVAFTWIERDFVESAARWTFPSP